MERLTRLDRPYVLAAAVAQDLNDELTIVLTGFANALERLSFDDPAMPQLLEAQAAAQRCAWRAAALLNYSARKGVLRGPVSVDRLLE